MRNRWPLLAVALVAFAVVVVRALRQSVTVDEADSFLVFVWRSNPVLWFTSPNNQVLNSMLETLSVNVFGASAASIRMPAMLGAAVFIASTTAICWTQIRDRVAGTLCLACLVLNPFILDYLVAARGYSLALGFLMCALFLLSAARIGRVPQTRVLIAASTAVGLSIAANFSFGIVDAVALVVFGSTYARASAWKNVLSLVSSLVLPAAIVVLAICGPAVLNFRSSELVYGTQSVAEMFGSVIANSFDGPNPYIVNPTLMPLFMLFRTIAPYLIVVTFAAALFWLFFKQNGTRAPFVPLLIVLAVAVPLQVVIPTLSHTPLPLNRTMLPLASVFILVVCLAFGSLEYVLLKRISIGLTAATAIFFCASGRSYFREWAYNSNVSTAYEALRRIVHEDKRATIGTDGAYISALNFYEATDPAPEFARLESNLPDFSVPPDDRDIYVLMHGMGDRIIGRLGLRVVYTMRGDGGSSDTLIAVKPGVKVPVLRYLPSDD